VPDTWPPGGVETTSPVTMQPSAHDTGTSNSPEASPVGIADRSASAVVPSGARSWSPTRSSSTRCAEGPTMATSSAWTVPATVLPVSVTGSTLGAPIADQSPRPGLDRGK
jgi:hypothetical protein